MEAARKINVLVIPDLFPKYDGDVQGIFLLDYLKSTAPYCNNQVLFVRVHGETKGLQISDEEGTKVYRYNVSAKKTRGLHKALQYVNWFRRGKMIAGQIQPVDIIHAHGSILSGTLAWMLAKKRKVPFILTEHTGPFSTVTNSFWKKRWTKLIMEKADLVLCVSEHQKQEVLGAGIRPKRIEVSFNPVDTQLFTPQATVAEKKNMLFAGRLDDFKGAYRCAQAFERISAQYPEWKLTIVGDGQEQQPIKEFLRQHPLLQGRILLKGRQSKKEIAEEMHQADFFVFPSLHESFGLVIAEALSSGLPVITTNRTAPREFVAGDMGLLIAPDSIAQIAAAMELLIKDHFLYKPVLLHERMVASFSFKNFGKKLLDRYASLLYKQ